MARSVGALTEVMRLTLHSPVEKLEQIGFAAADIVRWHQDAAKEASKLAALFCSNIEK